LPAIAGTLISRAINLALVPNEVFWQAPDERKRLQNAATMLLKGSIRGFFTFRTHQVTATKSFGNGWPEATGKSGLKSGFSGFLYQL